MSSVMTLKRYPSQGGMTFGKIGARRMMWSVNDLLPKGARWVEYLESTGTQYIDTAIHPTNNHGMRAEFSHLVYSNEDFNFLSARTPSQRFAFNYTSQKFGYGFNAYIVTNIPFNINSPSKHIAELNPYNRRYYSFDGSSGSINTTITDNLPTLVIFGQNASGLVILFNYRTYKFQMTFNNTLILDFRPIAIGTTGYMLDLVTGDYLQYGNAGTGDFVIGPDAQPPII